MSWIEQPPSEIVEYGNIELNLTTLIRDKFYLVINADKHRYSLWSLVEECYKCPFRQELADLYNGSSHPLNSKFWTTWEIKNDSHPHQNDTVCKLTPNVQEFGVYELNISPGGCQLDTIYEGVNIYLPILIVLAIYTSIGVALWLFFKYLGQYLKSKTDNVPQPKKIRIQSLDTFRGISIILMIFVNYGGGAYNIFEHAVWNGLTFADLVFPWFLWIMGVCIPISIRSALKRDEEKLNIFLNILRRSIILFMLGLCLNGVQTMESLRIFGVLQRFSLCYIFVASIHLVFTKKDIPDKKIKYGQDILILLPQWIIIIIIVIIHTLCIFLVEIPDCPVVGYLGPGGLQEGGKYINCTGGASNYIDKLFLGDEHLYKKPTFAEIYFLNFLPPSFLKNFPVPFDPEGFFSTLPALLTVFLGVQAGTTMQVYQKHIPRISNWMVWGIATGLIGGGLCGFSKEDGAIPINKNLWSLSFVFVTTCFAFILLTILYVIIDMKKIWSGKPFLFAGMNAIILYVGHNLTYSFFPFQWGHVEPDLHFQQLSQAVWGTFMWTLVSYWLYKIKFFLSI